AVPRERIHLARSGDGDVGVTLDAQDFLDLVERAGGLLIFDTEATGLNGDYNSMLVYSGKYYDKDSDTFTAERPGRDQKLVKQAREHLGDARCWVSYYGKGYDVKMINTRLLRWGLKPVDPRPHLDLYWTLKSALNTSRRSQAHLLEFLGMLPDDADVAELAKK